jgi:hypothetical protein
LVCAQPLVVHHGIPSYPGSLVGYNGWPLLLISQSGFSGHHTCPTQQVVNLGMVETFRVILLPISLDTGVVVFVYHAVPIQLVVDSGTVCDGTECFVRNALPLNLYLSYQLGIVVVLTPISLDTGVEVVLSSP